MRTYGQYDDDANNNKRATTVQDFDVCSVYFSSVSGGLCSTLSKHEHYCITMCIRIFKHFIRTLRLFSHELNRENEKERMRVRQKWRCGW